MNPIKKAASLAAIFLLASCGGERNATTTESSGSIDSAHIAGREAAREFIRSRWTDTLELQGKLLEARTKGAEYMKSGSPKAAAAFDSAFVSTIRTARPDVAAHLGKRSNSDRPR